MTVSPSQFNDSPPVPVGEATEHLAHLPKMSPTAGVTEQDYLAINGAAVAAMLAGLAAVLAIINDFLAVIPLGGVILAVIALRQIASSNGTQTGRGFAMTGLFLCTSILSYVVTTDAAFRLERRADHEAIAQLCRQLGQDISDHTYDSAYDLFSQRFKSRVSRQEFITKLKGLQDQLASSGLELGPITGATWNGLSQFFIDNDIGSFTADSEIDLHFAKSNNIDPLTAAFRKAGGVWTIESIPSLYPVGGRESR
jgi:hypothetical protein